MKKVIIIFGLVAIAGITFTISTLQQKNADNYKNSDRVEISKTALTQNDLKNIRQILNENSLQSQLNDLILNLSKSSNEILNKKNSKELITIANNNLASLFDCYIKNKCGVNESILN
jgi:5-bromo-4-chloroindolyl phosphate hydrolysis protein